MNRETSMKQFTIHEIKNCFSSDYALICFAGFEERCYQFVDASMSINISRTVCLCSDNLDVNTKHNLEAIKKTARNLSEKIINLSKPIDISGGLLESIQECAKGNNHKLIIDITCFTHEAIMILISVINQFKDSFQEVNLVYCPAAKYGSWLSRGCKEVRNVIRYPGNFDISYNYGLIVIPGFDLERATKVIEQVEPDELYVGFGAEPTHINHKEPMEQMRTKFQTWLSNFQSLMQKEFEFSCSDILVTKKALFSIIDKKKDNNWIAVPLNTKLSTVATALVCLERPRVQLVYPIPETYNTKEYSVPANYFVTFNLLDYLQ